MPTALAEWTTERPDVPGFYWWRWTHDQRTQVVELTTEGRWYTCGNETAITDADTGDWARGSSWWPVRLDPPPVG